MALIKLPSFLTAQIYTADAIHGDKSQTARQSALSMFKNGELRVLVATDIAARGIDIRRRYRTLSILNCPTFLKLMYTVLVEPAVQEQVV